MDMTKAKIGDVVHVKGIVERIGHELIAVNFGGGCRPTADVWISVNDIVHVEPAPLKVGDSVVWRGDAAKGSIIAIDTTNHNGAVAWVRASDGYGIIVLLDELERA